MNARRTSRRYAAARSGCLLPETLEARLMNSSTSLALRFGSVQGGTTDPKITGTLAVPTVAANPVVNESFDVRTQTIKVTIVSPDPTFVYKWESAETPSGGSVSFTKNNSSQAKENTLKFTRAGLYSIRLTVFQAKEVVSTSTLQFNVIPSLTGVSVTDADGRRVGPSSVLSTASSRIGMTATANDQFGVPLETQPDITWQLRVQPAGVTPTLSATGANATLEVPSAGRYLVRAVSGAVFLEVPINVTQTLTKLSLSLPEGGSVDSETPVDVLDKSARIQIAGVDQFGGRIVALPKIVWSALSAPTGAVFSGTTSAGNSKLTFDRAGDYSIQAAAGSVTVGMKASVKSALASIQIQNSEQKPLSTSAPSPVSGTTFSARAVALDQFGKVLENAPKIEWQISTAPMGGSAELTTTETGIIVTFNKAGNYVLRAVSGTVKSDVTVRVAPVLTSLSLATLTSEAISVDKPLTVTTDSFSGNVIGLDQFGNVVTPLPKIEWTAVESPDGGRVKATLKSTIATIGFDRPGRWVVKGQIGTASAQASFDVVSTLTRVGVVTSENAPVNVASGITVTGKSVQLVARGINQFGVPLADQPDVQWKISAAPTGGQGTVTQNGNSVNVAFNRTGQWILSAQTGNFRTDVKVNVVQKLTRLALTTTDDVAIDADQPLRVVTSQQLLKLKAFDQFDSQITVLPKITWTTQIAPAGGLATGKVSNGVATLGFSKAGNYRIQAASEKVTTQVTCEVIQTFQGIRVVTADNRLVNPLVPFTVTGTGLELNGTCVDQFGVTLAEQPTIEWTFSKGPTDAQPKITTAGGRVTVTFERAGSYTLTAKSGTIVLNLPITVTQTLMRIAVTPGKSQLAYRATQQFAASALDQFDRPLLVQPTMAWQASGGTISTSGLFTAGNVAGAFTVTATGGKKQGSASIEVAAPVLPSGLQNTVIAAAVSSAYTDGLINRSEMMSILRLGGNDGTVDATELADFQYLVNPQSGFSIPDYVRDLASDVVNVNPANARYQGSQLGNLYAGSSSSQLEQLIGKWFLGTDLPQTTNAGFTWTTSAGTLFNGNPSRGDTRQGMLGDCYFISALAAIADRNPNAIRRMFIDNGDDTYTIRFYAGQLGNYLSNGTMTYGFTTGVGVADFVTVNRKLPTNSNGALVYSGYGLNATALTTTLWIALAEKAYAQWNETGNEGRDGTNRYTAIEGGWMADVNAQVLGYNSTNHPFSSTPKTTLVNALTSLRAVTLGTTTSPSAGGLVGSHAYVVTGYDAATDTFRLHNPWGTSHPSPLTWAQLQANCSWFVVTDANGAPTTTSSAGGVVLQARPRVIADVQETSDGLNGAASSTEFVAGADRVDRSSLLNEVAECETKVTVSRTDTDVRNRAQIAFAMIGNSDREPSDLFLNVDLVDQLMMDLSVML